MTFSFSEFQEQEELQIEEIVQLFKDSIEKEWCFIQKEDYFKFCKLEENAITSIPQVSYMFTISLQNGKTSLHRYGQALAMEKIAFGDYDKSTESLKPFKDNVSHFISKLKTIAVENCSMRDLLKVSQSLVQQCIDSSEFSEVLSENVVSQNIVSLKFVSEQLKLISSEKRKYSPAIIRLAMMIKFYSSSGYGAIRDSKFMVLPSESTLHSYMVPKRESGINQARLVELSNVAKGIPETKREVSIIFDEMALQPNLNFDPSGQMEGFAANKPSGVYFINILN